MERAIGIELRKLSNLTCRYFEQQTNKKTVDDITGTNGWIIGYIAYQNRNAFKSTSAAYKYIWEIIHAVYGNLYDDEYKG